MKCPFDSLAGMLVVLALILGAWVQGHAVTRPSAAELLTVELCADGQAATVLLDTRGRPVDPADCVPGLCADCILTPPLAAAEGAAEPAFMSFASAVVPIRDPIAGAWRHHSAFLPRGPPETT